MVLGGDLVLPVSRLQHGQPASWAWPFGDMNQGRIASLQHSMAA